MQRRYSTWCALITQIESSSFNLSTILCWTTAWAAASVGAGESHVARPTWQAVSDGISPQQFQTSFLRYDSVQTRSNQVSRIEKTNERETEMQKKASMQMNRRTAPTFPTNECDIQVNDFEADDTPTLNASLQKYLPISAASRLAGSPRLGFKKWLSDWPSQHPSFKTKLFWELHHCAKESLLACWLSSCRRAVCAANFLDLLECKAL